MGMMRPGEILNNHNLKNQGDLFGFVVENDDSKAKDGKKLGRVKIRIPQLHRGIPDEDLPWSMPSSEATAHAGAGVGGVNVPPKGAKVGVKMQSNDPHVVQYGATVSTEDVSKEHPHIKDEDYPHVQGFKDHAGNVLRVNTKEGKVEASYTHVSGSSISIDKDGNIHFVSMKKLVFSSPEGVDISSDGPINVHSKGALSHKGATISQNGGDTAVTPAKGTAGSRPQIDQKQGRTDL